MICKNCNTENDEGALHCKHCGKLLDDRPVCPACGKKNAGDALFCTNCGTRLDGKTVCSACGEVYEGNFCPKCGASENGKKKPAAATANAKGWDWRKVVELCGGIFAMCGVFCVLLCTFLLGVSGGEFAGSQNIYYYFKEAYDDIGIYLDSFDSYSPAFEASYYLPAVIKTILAAGTILSVFVLSVLAAVRYGLKVSGKSEKDYAKYAIGAVMAFVIGCALFATVEWVSASARSMAETASARVGLNAAGTAGIACGAVCLAVFLACRVSLKGKELLAKQNIVQICFILGGLALLAIVTAFAVRPGYFSKFRLNSYSVKGSFGINFFYVGQVMAENEMNTEFALTIVSQIVQIAFVALAISAIVARMNSLASGKQKSELALSISTAAVAVVYLVLAIVTVNKCGESVSYAMDSILGNAFGISFDENMISYAYPIVALVFAVFGLIASVVHSVLIRKEK